MVTLRHGVGSGAQPIMSSLIKPAQPDRVLHLQVMFDLRNKPDWKKRHEEFEDPSSPLYHKFLSTEESRELGTIPASWYNEVGQWLTAQGFNITAYNQTFYRAIEFNGTVAQVNRTFNVEIMTTADGKNYGILRAPMIPARFQSTIAGIFGLDNISAVSPAAGGAAQLAPSR